MALGQKFRKKMCLGMRRNIVGFQQGLQALVLQGHSSRRQHGWVVIVKTSGKNDRLIMMMEAIGNMMVKK